MTVFLTSVAFAVFGAKESVSTITLVLAIAYGVATVLQYYFTILALESGSFAFTSLVISLSTILPTLSGLFWGEKIEILQMIGIAIMFVFFLFLFRGEREVFSWKWLLHSVVVFLSTGALGVLQKWHQSSSGAEERSVFLAIAFATALVLSVGLYFLMRKRGKPLFHAENGEDRKKIVWLCLIILVSAFALIVNNQLNLYLSGVVASVVFFPIINGANVILSTLAGLFLFHEKLTPKMWVGIALGTLSIILISLPVQIFTVPL